jgi:hypothetical protein
MLRLTLALVIGEAKPALSVGLVEVLGLDALGWPERLRWPRQNWLLGMRG